MSLNGPLYNWPVDNVAAAATASVQSGTAQTGYEAAYLIDVTDANLERPAKLNELTGAWNLHYPAAQRIDCVMLWHNFDVGLACDWRGGNTFGSPTLTSPFTIPAKRADGFTTKQFMDLRGVTGYTTSGFADWWLNVSGTNSVAIGAKVWCGSIVRQLTVNVDWGLHEQDIRPAIVLSTDFVPSAWTYDFGVTPRAWSGAPTAAADADRNAIRDWFRATGLGLTVVVPDPIGNPTEAWLVRWNVGGSFGEVAFTKRTLDKTLSFLNVNVVPLAFEEITAGAPEWS